MSAQGHRWNTTISEWEVTYLQLLSGQSWSNYDPDDRSLSNGLIEAVDRFLERHPRATLTQARNAFGAEYLRRITQTRRPVASSSIHNHQEHIEPVDIERAINNVSIQERNAMGAGQGNRSSDPANAGESSRLPRGTSTNPASMQIERPLPRFVNPQQLQISEEDWDRKPSKRDFDSCALSRPMEGMSVATPTPLSRPGTPPTFRVPGAGAMTLGLAFADSMSSMPPTHPQAMPGTATSTSSRSPSPSDRNRARSPEQPLLRAAHLSQLGSPHRSPYPSTQNPSTQNPSIQKSSIPNLSVPAASNTNRWTDHNKCPFPGCGKHIPVEGMTEHFQDEHCDVEKSSSLCPYEGCSARFEKFTEMHTHTKYVRHDSQLRLKCGICREMFKSWSEWHSHIREDHRNDPTISARYRCKFPGCVSHYSQKWNLKKRLAEIHDPLKPENNSTLEWYIESQKTFCCAQCSARFPERRYLYDHRQRQHNPKPSIPNPLIPNPSIPDPSVPDPWPDRSKCPFGPFPGCGLPIPIEGMVDHFLIAHTDADKDSVLCPYEGCSKRFRSILEVIAHEKIAPHHPQKTPIRCDLCGIQCNSRAHWIAHIRDGHQNNPSKSEPFCCRFPGCGEPFWLKRDLKFHIQRHHDPENPLPVALPERNRKTAKPQPESEGQQSDSNDKGRQTAPVAPSKASTQPFKAQSSPFEQSHNMAQSGTNRRVREKTVSPEQDNGQSKKAKKDTDPRGKRRR